MGGSHGAKLGPEAGSYRTANMAIVQKQGIYKEEAQQYPTGDALSARRLLSLMLVHSMFRKKGKERGRKGVPKYNSKAWGRYHLEAWGKQVSFPVYRTFRQ